MLNNPKSNHLNFDSDSYVNILKKLSTYQLTVDKRVIIKNTEVCISTYLNTLSVVKNLKNF